MIKPGKGESERPWLSRGHTTGGRPDLRRTHRWSLSIVSSPTKNWIHTKSHSSPIIFEYLSKARRSRAFYQPYWRIIVFNFFELHSESWKAAQLVENCRKSHHIWFLTSPSGYLLICRVSRNSGSELRSSRALSSEPSLTSPLEFSGSDWGFRKTILLARRAHLSPSSMDRPHTEISCRWTAANWEGNLLSVNLTPFDIEITLPGECLILARWSFWSLPISDDSHLGKNGWFYGPLDGSWEVFWAKTATCFVIRLVSK
jgi:hypothetical protein